MIPTARTTLFGSAGRSGQRPLVQRGLLRLLALALSGWSLWWVWLLDGPAPTAPILWTGIGGIGETRPGAPYGFFSFLSRSGTPSERSRKFTFWGDDLVYWSGEDHAFAIVPPVGPIRWTPFSEARPGFSVRPVCANHAGIVASVERYTPEEGESIEFFRVHLSSGAIEEIPDAANVQCSESSSEMAVQTMSGRVELWNGSTHHLLAARPGNYWWYDFQNRLLCTLNGKDVTLWRAGRKLWSVTPLAPSPLIVMLDPARRRLYTIADLGLEFRYLECYDYEGHRTAHQAVHYGLWMPLFAPNRRQLRAVERLALLPGK